MTGAAAKRPLLCIVDDDDAFRDSLCVLLADDDFDVVSLPSADALLAQLHQRRPDCALVDLHMPGKDGMALLGRLRAEDESLPVIIITGRGDMRSAVRAVQAGAMDFLEKPVERETLLRLVHEGFARSATAANRRDDEERLRARFERLTGREREVCERMLWGKPSKVIAHELGISPRTVEIHRSRVMQKLDVDSPVQLVRTALRARLLPEEVR